MRMHAVTARHMHTHTLTYGYASRVIMDLSLTNQIAQFVTSIYIGIM